MDIPENNLEAGRGSKIVTTKVPRKNKDSFDWFDDTMPSVDEWMDYDNNEDKGEGSQSNTADSPPGAVTEVPSKNNRPSSEVLLASPKNKKRKFSNFDEILQNLNFDTLSLKFTKLLMFLESDKKEMTLTFTLKEYEEFFIIILKDINVLKSKSLDASFRDVCDKILKAATGYLLTYTYAYKTECKKKVMVVSKEKKSCLYTWSAECLKTSSQTSSKADTKKQSRSLTLATVSSGFKLHCLRTMLAFIKYDETKSKQFPELSSDQAFYMQSILQYSGAEFNDFERNREVKDLHRSLLEAMKIYSLKYEFRIMCEDSWAGKKNLTFEKIPKQKCSIPIFETDSNQTMNPTTVFQMSENQKAENPKSKNSKSENPKSEIKQPENPLPDVTIPSFAKPEVPKLAPVQQNTPRLSKRILNVQIKRENEMLLIKRQPAQFVVDTLNSILEFLRDDGRQNLVLVPKTANELEFYKKIIDWCRASRVDYTVSTYGGEPERLHYLIQSQLPRVDIKASKAKKCNKTTGIQNITYIKIPQRCRRFLQNIAQRPPKKKKVNLKNVLELAGTEQIQLASVVDLNQSLRNKKKNKKQKKAKSNKANAVASWTDDSSSACSSRAGSRDRAKVIPNAQQVANNEASSEPVKARPWMEDAKSGSSSRATSWDRSRGPPTPRRAMKANRREDETRNEQLIEALSVPVQSDKAMSNEASSEPVKARLLMEDAKSGSSSRATSWDRSRGPPTPRRAMKANRREDETRKEQLIEALSVPVQSDKAMRMMRGMGWDGGALGARGVGITEPLMPNLDLPRGAGLGHTRNSQPATMAQKVIETKTTSAWVSDKPQVVKETENDIIVKKTKELVLGNCTFDSIKKMVEPPKHSASNVELSKRNVELPTQSKSNFELPTQSKSNVELPTQSKSNVERTTQSKSNVELPTQSKSNVELPTQSKSNVELPTQSKSNVELTTQSKSNVELPTQSKSNVELLTQSKSNVELPTQSKSNVEWSKPGTPCTDLVISEYFDRLEYLKNILALVNSNATYKTLKYKIFIHLKSRKFVINTVRIIDKTKANYSIFIKEEQNIFSQILDKCNKSPQIIVDAAFRTDFKTIELKKIPLKPQMPTELSIPTESVAQPQPNLSYSAEPTAELVTEEQIKHYIFSTKTQYNTSKAFNVLKFKVLFLLNVLNFVKSLNEEVEVSFNKILTLKEKTYITNAVDEVNMRIKFGSTPVETLLCSEINEHVKDAFLGAMFNHQYTVVTLNKYFRFKRLNRPDDAVKRKGQTTVNLDLYKSETVSQAKLDVSEPTDRDNNNKFVENYNYADAVAKNLNKLDENYSKDKETITTVAENNINIAENINYEKVLMELSDEDISNPYDSDESSVEDYNHNNSSTKVPGLSPGQERVNISNFLYLYDKAKPNTNVKKYIDNDSASNMTENINNKNIIGNGNVVIDNNDNQIIDMKRDGNCKTTDIGMDEIESYVDSDDPEYNVCVEMSVDIGKEDDEANITENERAGLNEQQEKHIDKAATNDGRIGNHHENIAVDIFDEIIDEDLLLKTEDSDIEYFNSQIDCWEDILTDETNDIPENLCINKVVKDQNVIKKENVTDMMEVISVTDRDDLINDANNGDGVEFAKLNKETSINPSDDLSVKQETKNLDTKTDCDILKEKDIVLSEKNCDTQSLVFKVGTEINVPHSLQDMDSEIKTVRIVHVCHPRIKLTKQKLTEIQRLISNTIMLTLELPLLKCHGIQNGALVYTSHNKKTYDWLLKTLNVDSCLKVLNTKEVTKMALKFYCFFEYSSLYLFKMIELYNRELSTEKWVLKKTEKDGDYVIFIVKMDKFSIKFIQESGLSLFAGVDKVQFSPIWE